MMVHAMKYVSSILLGCCMQFCVQGSVLAVETSASYIQSINTRLNDRESLAIAVSVRVASMRYDIPEEVLLALMQVESSFDHSSVSPRKAVGLMQIHLPTWIYNKIGREQLIEGVGSKDVLNPFVNIQAGAWILRSYMEQCPSGNPLVYGLMRYRGGKKNSHPRVVLRRASSIISLRQETER